MITSCASLNPQPNPAEIDAIVQSNINTFDFVTDYLLAKEESYLFIEAADGKYFSEFEWKELNDTHIEAALRKLWRVGCTRIIKDEDCNSIFIAFGMP